jgi:cytochrome b6-f complex iron-sulfur subunit
MMTDSNPDTSPVNTDEPERASRRTFLNRLWAGLGLMALVELIVVGTSFLRRGKSASGQRAGTATISCGSADRYQPGTVTAFVSGRFYLACLADGGFLAISRQCTHLGCTVPWDADAHQFACPCHASVFDITGAVVNAPASRALDLYPLTIENREITVDTSRPLRRSGFEPAQAVYAKAP